MDGGMIEQAAVEAGGDTAPAEAATRVPRVSLGLPAYRNAGTIARSIASIRAQTFTDWALVISDDCSPDNTLAEIREAVGDDPRITVVAQKTNLGMNANFTFVFERAEGDYFAFHAGDDWMAPTFLEEAVAALDSNPAASCCAPITVMHREGRTRRAAGTVPISGPGWWRIAWYLVRPACSSRYYGLHRTSMFRRVWRDIDDARAMDWLVCAMSLSEGRHVTTPSVALNRTGAGWGKYTPPVRRGAGGWLAAAAPLHTMSRRLLARLPVSQRVLAVPMLAVLNLRQGLEDAILRLRG
ncbi:MAG: glycosyltransferase family 2 protein [Pseudomonadota bacterium]